MLSWQDVLASGMTQESGYNVVIHEFAHKIDMRDGAADGCPPCPPVLPAAATPGRRARRGWVVPAYERFREQVIVAERFGGEMPWLDAYGAESISEFFAVACEAYFVNRPRFALEFDPLLRLFDQFYKPNGP